jgi:hypothetical protein
MTTQCYSSEPRNTEQTPPPIHLSGADLELRPLFAEYRQAYVEREQAALELDRCLLKWRNEYKRQGRAGQGFRALLSRLKIPSATAYRLIQAADPNFVSSETKFDLERILGGLCRWSKKLPNGLKDCSDEVLEQLKNVQAELKDAEARITKLISDAERVRRTESSICAGLPLSNRRKPIRVNIRAGQRSIAARAELASARWDMQRIVPGQEGNGENQIEAHS